MAIVSSISILLTRLTLTFLLSRRCVYSLVGFSRLSHLSLLDKLR